MKFWALSSDSANCFAICTVLIRYSQMLYRTYFFMVLIFLSLPSYCPIPTNTPCYYLLTFFSFCFFRLLNHKNMGMLPGTAQHCTSSAAVAVKTCERNKPSSKRVTWGALQRQWRMAAQDRQIQTGRQKQQQLWFSRRKMSLHTG